MFAERMKKKKLNEPEVDEEGFTKVTYKRSDKLRVRQKSKEKKPKKKSKIIPNFYRHQEREAKRKQIEELQAKFQQDKERIAKLTATRKFRPY